MATDSLSANGRTIGLIRRFRLLSQADLAGRLGMSESWVAAVETGRVRCASEMVERIAAVLEVEPEALAS